MSVISNQWSVIRNVVVGKDYRPLLFLLLIAESSWLNAEPTSQRSPQVVAQISFFERHAEGWHWYQDRESEIRDQESGEKTQQIVPQTPTQAIEAQRKALETKLHAAIIEPSRENITAYLFAQKALMDQSERFSEEWKKVVMTTPALDESLVHPVDQNARPLYYAEQRKDLEKRIKGLAQEYGLFFFFRQNCSYCHGFAPLVKRFSEKYGWSVLAISLDGSSTSILPEFPHAKRDNGIAKKLQITHVPALVAIHPKTGQLIPLAYGMISESEIEARVELLTKVLVPASKPTSYEENFKR
jgi:conjugal transfer pilus assembly protein TraF